MASLDWEFTRRDGITLVELYVTADTDEQVRIESNLEPVWPPRRQGVAVAGWDDTGFDGTVDAGRPLVVGYATPAQPEEPPAELVSPEESESETTAREVVRTLGDASPPRDAVPTPTDATEQGVAESQSSEDHAGDGFDEIENRIERAERLSRVTEVDEARALVADAGGLERVRTLTARLEADRQRLADCRERTVSLQNRLDSVDVPLATLERVA